MISRETPFTIDMNRQRPTAGPAWLGLLFCCAPLLACGETELPPGVVTLVIGQESHAWSADPPATHVRVEAVQNGTRTTLADAPGPATTVSIGHGGPENMVLTFEATGLSADETPVLHGLTAPRTVFGYDDASLSIFLGRNGGFSRAAGALQYEHHHPILVPVGGSAFFVAGGDAAGSDATQLDVYDVSQCSLVSEANLPQAAGSVASFATSLVLIGDSGSVSLDLIAATSTALSAPSGLSFSEVIGGQTVIAPDGSEYVIGGTRDSGDPTDKVLHVAADGTLNALKLSVPRLNAAATFVEGGLLIVGGSANGAGAELLTPGATDFVPLALPADETVGAGLTQLTPTTALLVGGHDAAGVASVTRSIDLSCTADCTQTALPSLEFALARTQAFALTAHEVLVVGETADGETHAYAIDTSVDTLQAVEQAFRARRAGASAALLPNGQVAVAGGDDPGSGSAVSSLEVFFP